MLAERASPHAPVVWIREERGARRGGAVFGMGLVELGLNPARFLFAIVPDMTALSVLKLSAQSYSPFLYFQF